MEITTKCHARCPQCSRNFRGDTNPILPQVELSLSDAEQVFPPSFVKQLGELHICGNYGDPTAAQDTVEVMQYLRATNPDMMLQIMTHGSARSVEWWAALASIGVRSHFAIDGLEDTNHIYRQRTNWKTIMRNATAFIEAGGHAIWEFIVFGHNEHQVEEARSLSERMGFKKFNVKKSARFLYRTEQEIFATDGSVTGMLRAPTKREFTNDGLVAVWKDYSDGDRHRQYIDTTEISCKAANTRGIFVSAEALVFPCCYLGVIYPSVPSQGAAQRNQLLEQIPGGRSAICALDHPITEIVDGPFFQETIPKGWAVGPGRIHTCAHMCGSYDYVGAQRK